MDAFDVVVSNCRVVDGTGGPWFRGDVAIGGDRIAAVGVLDGASATTRVEGDDLVLAPGFVDAHVHTDAQLLADPAQAASLFQGVTTHIIGQDGFGFAPTTERSFPFMRAYTSGINGARPPLGPGGVGDFLARLDGATAVNAATLVPNGCARMDVIGNAGRAATDGEVEEMAAICRCAVAEGAVGLSSGLDYVPSRHASTDELAALSAAAGGVYVTHIRYSDGLLAALEEAIEIGRRSRVPVHVSHLKGDDATGVRAADILALVDAARDRGIDVTFDLYPYSSGATVLPYLFPAWLFEGDLDEIRSRLADPLVRERVRTAPVEGVSPPADATLAGELSGERARYVGLDLPSAARLAGQDVVDFGCDLLLAEDLSVILVWKPVGAPQVEADLRTMLTHATAMVGSDGIYTRGRVHPRGWGAFARFVGRFVREEGVLPFEEAVRRVTSFPARRFGLSDRGLVRAGFAADLVLLDPAAFTDRSTYEEGAVLAEGVRDVFVNGVAVLRDGALTGATPGRGLGRREAV